jgi:hypothetical protein
MVGLVKSAAQRSMLCFICEGFVPEHWLHQKKAALSASFEFEHSAANGAAFLKRPLVINAAKVSKEPTADLSKSCCARSQRENCGKCANLYAATQRKNQPFMK